MKRKFLLKKEFEDIDMVFWFFPQVVLLHLFQHFG